MQISVSARTQFSSTMFPATDATKKTKTQPPNISNTITLVDKVLKSGRAG